MANTTSNPARPIFQNYTKANPGIPEVPVPLPGSKSSKYKHTPSRHKQTTVRNKRPNESPAPATRDAAVKANKKPKSTVVIQLETPVAPAAQYEPTKSKSSPPATDATATDATATATENWDEKLLEAENEFDKFMSELWGGHKTSEEYLKSRRKNEEYDADYVPRATSSGYGGWGNAYKENITSNSISTHTLIADPPYQENDIEILKKTINRQTEQLAHYQQKIAELEEDLLNAQGYSEYLKLRLNELEEKNEPICRIKLQNGGIISIPSPYSDCDSVYLECSSVVLIGSKGNEPALNAVCN